MEKVEVDTTGCLEPCSGLLITSFAKSDQEENIEDLIPIFKDYDRYKNISQYPSGINGDSKIKCILKN